MSNGYSESSLVWHYTKMNVLEKIFPPEGKDGHGMVNLRFTNARFTNDPAEALLLRKLILENRERILKLLKEEFRNEDFNIDEDFNGIEKESDYLSSSYVFCATNQKDSMNFWKKEYAGKDGIAIGFDKKYFERKKFRFSNIIYSNTLDDKSIKDIVDKIHKSYIVHKRVKEANPNPELNWYMGKLNILTYFLETSSSLFKNESWESEEETRIILTNFTENYYKEPGYKLLKYMMRKTPKTLIDDLECKVEFIGNDLKKVCYKSFEKNSVVSIMLGPNCKLEHEEAIKYYLVTNGYYSFYDIPIIKSSAFDLQYKHDN